MRGLFGYKTNINQTSNLSGMAAGFRGYWHRSVSNVNQRCWFECGTDFQWTKTRSLSYLASLQNTRFYRRAIHLQVLYRFDFVFSGRSHYSNSWPEIKKNFHALIILKDRRTESNCETEKPKAIFHQRSKSPKRSTVKIFLDISESYLHVVSLFSNGCTVVNIYKDKSD